MASSRAIRWRGWPIPRARFQVSRTEAIMADAIMPGSIMADAFAAGSILVEEGTQLPDSLLLQSASSSNGWAAIKDARAVFEKGIQDAGWTFFFMAGEVKTTVFGFDRQKTLGTAWKRLTSTA